MIFKGNRDEIHQDYLSLYLLSQQCVVKDATQPRCKTTCRPQHFSSIFTERAVGNKKTTETD